MRAKHKSIIMDDLARNPDWKEQFEATFNHLPIGLSYLTPDMRFIRMNPFLERRLGLRSEDVAGKHCYDIVGMYKDDPTRKGRERICDNCGVALTLRSGKPFRTVRRVNGSFIGENLSVPVKDKDGAILGVVEIISDVTGKPGIEERLGEETPVHYAPPDKDGRDKDEFLAMVMHDLKTPLTSIAGYASLILSGELGPVDAEIKQSMEGIHANAQRMMELARNFLIAGKLNESALHLEPKPTELGPLVIGCLRNMEPQINDKGLLTQTHFEPGLPAVLADREYMERVLSNLIANAVKFTPFGGRLALTAYRAGAYVNIELSDTGIGISDEDLPMVFMKFYQGKGSSRSRGTGLGLYIAKSIVEAHHGSITASSPGGSGATFTISLPIA